jgi:hypothetical protein
MKGLLFSLLSVLPVSGFGQSRYEFRIDSIYEAVFSENYTPFQALSVLVNDYELTVSNRGLDIKTCECVILERVLIRDTKVPLVWAIDLKRKNFEYGTGYQTQIIYSKKDKDVVHIRYEEERDDINLVMNLYLYSEILFIYGKKPDSKGNLVNYFYVSQIIYL